MEHKEFCGSSTQSKLEIISRYFEIAIFFIYAVQGSAACCFRFRSIASQNFILITIDASKTLVAARIFLIIVKSTSVMNILESIH